MFRTNIYPKLVLFASFVMLGFGSLSAQTSALDLKLQLIDDDTWGVYVRPDTSLITPSSSTITGAGQVTIVMPLGLTWGNLTSVSGTWTNNANVHGPAEAPTKSYISFGFSTDVPHVNYLATGEPTLLFTIDRLDPCPDTMFLFENGVDPFEEPNSVGSNPGNNLEVFDSGVMPFGNYQYRGNYAFSAWSCHDCDGDLILNGLEDTNGNGTFDVLEDSSALCDPCDPIHVETAELEFVDGLETICAGDLGDTAYFVVHIEGGWVPYEVHYTDGTNNYSVNNYQSGDTIGIAITGSANITLTNVIDSFGCAIDPDSMFGTLPLSVHGPITFTDHPDDVTECSNYGTCFAATSANAGDGTTYYKWQVSTDGGVSWGDLDDGSVYDNTDTDSMCISTVAGKDSYRYRVKIWTDVCDTVYSNSALLRVEGPININTQPANFVNCHGEDASFTSTAVNAGAVGTMSYVWQVSTNGGTTWANLANGAGPGGATYAGVGSTTLNLTNIAQAMDGWDFRLSVATGQCDVIYSNAANLDVEGPLSIAPGGDPDDVSNCAGNEVYFISQFLNPGSGQTNYIWQISTDNGATWANLTNASGVYTGISGTNVGTSGSDTLAISNVLGLDGFMYRIAYTSPTCGNSIFSAAALLDVSGNVLFSDNPDDITLCSGGDTIFVANASISQGSFYYGWQYSNDGGANWNNITLPSGVFSHTEPDTISGGPDTLRISNVAGMYDFRFRAVAYATDCDSIVSAEARLSIEGPLSITDHPNHITECSGNAVTFAAVVDNPGVANSSIYRWQVNTSGDSTNAAAWVNLTNNVVFNGTGTPTLSISNVAGMHNYYFRLRAGTSTCSVLYTYAAVLTVEGPITVTANPTDVTLCSGSSTSFTSTANVGTAGTLQYQWQVTTDGINYSNLSNAGVYSGVTTTTLNISDVTGLYGRCYRLSFRTGECAAVYSQRACLNVEGPISITNQPDTITQCNGEAVIFGVATLNPSPDDSGVFYQWQESTNNGTTWSNLPNDTLYNGTQTDTMSIAYTVGLANNLYRVLVWTGTCDTLTSSVALLRVEGPLTVLDEPDNISECSGSGVTFQATISNAGLGTLIYQWEYSSDNGLTWTDVPAGGINGFGGVTSPTLIVNDVVGLYNYRFRMRYRTANCDAQFTNYAVLTVEGPIGFDALAPNAGQPQSVTECSGNGTNFSVTTTNTGSGQITYQWQVSLDNGANWFNLVNNSIFNGVTTANLSVSNVAGLNGRCFHVLIQTANCASDTSAMACLNVEGPITITDHPDDITQCSAESVTFTGAAAIQVGNVGTMTYQWQVSSDGGLNWSNLSDGGAPGYVGTTTASMSITNVAGLNGRRYRLAVRTTECNPTYSNPAILTVEGPLAVAVGGHPDDITNCSDKEAIFAAVLVNPGQGGFNYQWQQSTDGGTTWQNLYDGELTNGAGVTNNYAGTGTDTLLISPIDSLNGTRYRLLGWTGTCDTLITNEALLGVEGPLHFTDEPDDVTLCSTSPTSFTVAVVNESGAGTIQYQWQMSTNNFTWTDLTNTSPYSGVTTNTLSISNTAGLGGRKYRCRIRTGDCEWDASVPATLVVEGPINIVQQPVNIDTCSNQGATFATTVTNPGSGALQFQWQVSANGGTSWANITNFSATGFGGTYQGTKTEDLAISLTEGLDGYLYRLTIRTGTCFDTTNTIELTVRDACLSATCDFDLDGEDNGVPGGPYPSTSGGWGDLDDDGDQLSDIAEIYINDSSLIKVGFYDPYSNCNIDTDNDGILDNQEDPDGDNITNGEETDGDGIFDGDPLDPCDPILGPTCVGINLAIKVYLQGALLNTGGDTLMRDDLRELDYLPEQEPYTGIYYPGSPPRYPFEHVGEGGGEEIDSSIVFDVSDENAIVDWVFVELRSSTALDSVAVTRAALLQRDGDVVDMDGVSHLHFGASTLAGEYYVAVRHRNHLGVMTGEAIELSPILQYIDFTDPATLTSGIYSQVNINGRMALWGGDLNSDGKSIYQGPGNDVNQLFFAVMTNPNNVGQGLANYISYGYATTDYDLNGKSIYQGPGNDRAMHLFNTILNHPANPSLLANYVVLETLP